jgi:phenylacetate-CoA ligase
VLLNYRIGDRGVIDPRPCPCGRTLPLLASFEGRRSEMIALPDGREISSLVLESMFRAELRSTLRAQIQQLGPGRLRWRVVPARSADPAALRRAFVERAARSLGPGVSLTVQFADAIATTREGKLVRAIRRDGDGAPDAGSGAADGASDAGG